MRENQESKSFVRKHWEEYEEFWPGRFSFLGSYSRFLYPEKPLPQWDSSVVEEFIASDLVHGPTNLGLGFRAIRERCVNMCGIGMLKTTREAAKFGVVGAVVGAVSTARYAWKWSTSPHGAVLSFAVGAAVGGTFGIEIANHWYQLI